MSKLTKSEFYGAIESICAETEDQFGNPFYDNMRNTVELIGNDYARGYMTHFVSRLSEEDAEWDKEEILETRDWDIWN